jgi:hypothetical protein
MEYTWNEIKTEIYFIDGSWRDIFINNITDSEWESWIKYVNEHYEIDWNGKNKINYGIIKNAWNENDELPEMAKIIIGKIQINNHFFMDFENDIDPEEIETEYEHKCIIDYMNNISELLNKEVFLSVENCRDKYLIKIYKGKIEYNI